MKSNIYILIPTLLFTSHGFGQFLNYKMYTHTMMTTWQNAREYCREHHTDLLTIRNKKDNKNYEDPGGWIGLHRESPAGQWKWSRSNETAEFFNWDYNEPNHTCAFKYHHTGKWNSHPCHFSHSFICYDENLILVKENKTWEEALEHCRSLGKEDVTLSSEFSTVNHHYDLVTIITKEDHADAQIVAQDATTEEVWTGLRFMAGHWFWVGGEPVQLQNLTSCPAVPACGVLEKNGDAFSAIRDCTEKRNFLCYKKP